MVEIRNTSLPKYKLKAMESIAKELEEVFSRSGYGVFSPIVIRNSEFSLEGTVITLKAGTLEAKIFLYGDFPRITQVNGINITSTSHGHYFNYEEALRIRKCVDELQKNMIKNSFERILITKWNIPYQSVSIVGSSGSKILQKGSK